MRPAPGNDFRTRATSHGTVPTQVLGAVAPTLAWVAKKRRGKGRGPRRPYVVSAPTRQPYAGESAETAQLFQSLRTGLRSDDPTELLILASGFLAATDPRGRDPFAGTESHTTLPELVESFIGTPYAETTAALTALRPLMTDELTAARIGRELANRPHPMPVWLSGLDRAQLEPDVWFMTHALGDGDDYLIGITLPSGKAVSALIYVDHNLGTVVKDAFVVAEPLEDLAIKLGTLIEDNDQSLTRTDPAAARAVIEDAIAHGARLYPQPTSDTWPMCRPLVEWMVRMLPTGGTVPGPKERSEQEIAAIATDFFASPFGTRLDYPDERSLLNDVLWFGTDYATGDPYRWSPVTVEMLLADWFPRKIVAAASYLAKLPNLIRAYIRYCHDRQGIRAELTEETLAAVAEWEPEYQRLIRSARPQGPAALLAAMFDDEPGTDPDANEFMLESLDRRVGGRMVLQNLDDAPLPDEPFEWAGIAEDIRPVVQEMLNDCDRCADELLDVEHRTAMRRFLSRAAVGDPAIFRRKASPRRGAAAVAWVICRANDTVGKYFTGMTVQELMAWFGVKGSPSQRAAPFLRANGVNPHELYGVMDLGAPDLLTGTRRAETIELRDQFLGR